MVAVERREQPKVDPIPRLDPVNLTAAQIRSHAEAIHQAQQRIHDEHRTGGNLVVLSVAELEDLITRGEMYLLGFPGAVEVSFYLTRLGDVAANRIPGAGPDDQSRVDVRKAGGFFAVDPMSTLRRCLESYRFADRPDDIVLTRTSDVLGKSLVRRQGYVQVPIPVLEREYPELYHLYFTSGDYQADDRSMYIRLPLETPTK